MLFRSAAVPKPSALSIAVQYHQPCRNLAIEAAKNRTWIARNTMENSSPGDVVKAIMTVLERHSAMSVKEIMRELQLTPLAATSGMRELMKEGRVARVKFADDPVQRYRLKG